MKVYTRNHFLKVISGFFILVHIFLGTKMFSTDNYILGTITLVAGLYWVYSLINEFSPYLKIENNKLLLYKNRFSAPREFNLNKDVQLYYHSKDRLVFTYISPDGIRTKAKIFLGYLNPKASTEFVQEFRSKINNFNIEKTENKNIKKVVSKKEKSVKEQATMVETIETKAIEDKPKEAKTKGVREVNAKGVKPKVAKPKVAKPKAVKPKMGRPIDVAPIDIPPADDNPVETESIMV